MSKFDITEIDKNFKADVSFENMNTYNALSEPFEINGVTFDGKKFVRMPEEIAESVSKGVYGLYANTSGGRIRFRTTTQKITLTAILPDITNFNHMPKSGTGSFDIYDKEDYRGFFSCNYKLTESGAYKGSATLDLKTNDMHDITINFPLYNNVLAVYISLEKDCALEKPLPEKYKTPIVYYGSSITQGGCASHAGNAYQNIISRRLSSNFVNLGFSGSCKAELPMMDYLATLDMSIFVYDYDHNAPNHEFLRSTHEIGFKRFREKRPDVPVIMITSADISTDREKRIEVIRTTYENAVKSGDKNVYFINGDDIYASVGKQYCTVDKCHPNDLGFFCMANAIEPVIRKILEEK